MIARKLTSILLFFCLVAPLVAIYSGGQIKRSKIRKEVKWKMIAGLNPEELVLIAVAKSEETALLKWKHKKEFEFNGEMYDIAHRWNTNDSLYFRCWWDHDETRLNKQLNQLLASTFGKDPDMQRQNDQLLSFFKSLYVQGVIELNPCPIQERIQYAGKTVYHPQRCLIPPVPPPEMT